MIILLQKGHFFAFSTNKKYLIRLSMADLALQQHNRRPQKLKQKYTQEGYIEELSTCFYLDTALLKSSESVLSEK